MTGAIFIGFLACAALAFIAQPVRRGPPSEDAETDLRFEEAETRKMSALAAIVDMENEVTTGKLSDEDFGVLRDRYEAEAVDALRELDRLTAAVRDDDDLEREIATMRSKLTCADCGALREPDSACGRCGAR
jgi:hypothetical protein